MIVILLQMMALVKEQTLMKQTKKEDPERSLADRAKARVAIHTERDISGLRTVWTQGERGRGARKRRYHVPVHTYIYYTVRGLVSLTL